MESAFGIDHGDISKGLFSGGPKMFTSNANVAYHSARTKRATKKAGKAKAEYQQFKWKTRPDAPTKRQRPAPDFMKPDAPKSSFATYRQLGNNMAKPGGNTQFGGYLKARDFNATRNAQNARLRPKPQRFT